MTFGRFLVTAGGSMASRLKSAGRQHNKFWSGQLQIACGLQRRSTQRSDGSRFRPIGVLPFHPAGYRAAMTQRAVLSTAARRSS
jgi:hypothetical protein